MAGLRSLRPSDVWLELTGASGVLTRLGVMRRRRVWAVLLSLALLLVSLSEARRSGGGFGGSRSYRTSPFRAPSYRSPTLRYPRVVPAPRYRSPYRQIPRSTFPRSRSSTYRSRGFSFFLPFFGLLPFALFGIPTPGVAGLLLNVLLVVVALSLLSRLFRVRRY